MIRDWMPPVFAAPADRMVYTLRRSRFRPARSWEEAVRRTPGYEAVTAPPVGRPWETPASHLNRSDVEVVAAIGAVLQHLGERATRRVLDFGGSYGHHFGVARAAFPSFAWDWTVCDTPRVADYGRALGAPRSLRWNSREEVAGTFDIALASGSLHYVEEPAAVLEWLMRDSRFVIVNRTPLWPLDKDAISYQVVDGAPAYPAWFLSRASFERRINASGQVLMTWTNSDQAFFAGHRGPYTGMVIRTDA